MSDQTTLSSGKTLIEIPLRICLGTPDGGASSGTTSGGIWESGWFDTTVSTSHYFAHKLNFPDPWNCIPMLVGRVKTASSGWEVGEILFFNGCNLNGNNDHYEQGFAITVSDIDAQVSMGNGGAISCTKRTGGYGGINRSAIECKLVIHY